MERGSHKVRDNIDLLQLTGNRMISDLPCIRSTSAARVVSVKAAPFIDLVNELSNFVCQRGKSETEPCRISLGYVWGYATIFLTPELNARS